MVMPPIVGWLEGEGMRKGKTVVGLAAVVLVAALIGAKACSPDRPKPTKTAEKSDPSGDTRGAANGAASLSPTPRGSGAIEVTRRDAGPEGVVLFSPWGGSKGNHLGRE